MPVTTLSPRQTATNRAPTSTRNKPAMPAPTADLDTRCAQALAALRQRADEATRKGMARYAIPTEHALGVSMREVQAIAKTLRRDHALANALWQSGIYEARMLACYVADPSAVTPAQMDRWVRSIDNWAHCDTACFALFDRTPHAWKKIEQWAKQQAEFVKRAAFALLASVALHHKTAGDEKFLQSLELIEAAADDPRNFVRKAVNWALRAIGKRNTALCVAAITLAQRLSASDNATKRWIGKDALRELNRRLEKTKK
ncbi:MAG: DNA alkylation repair protein [Rhodanobacteraceae bacterium]|nr:DNA alkylation repair protein [Rhodanobacteraceae bacterium]